MQRQCECYSLIGSKAHCLNKTLWIVQFVEAIAGRTGLAYLCYRHLCVFNKLYHVERGFPLKENEIEKLAA